MEHFVAFTSSITNSSALLELALVADSVLSPSDSGVLTSARLPLLLASGIVGASVIGGEIQSPTLRDLGFFDLSPVNVGATFESPVRARSLRSQPVKLNAPEGLHVLAAQGGSGAEDDYGFVIFGDGQTRKPVGRPIAIAFDASATLVAGAWSPFTPVLRQALAAGRYAIVGVRVNTATGLFFRIIPNDSGSFRPGGLVVQADDQLDWEGQVDGSWGTWLEFESYSIPSIEVFAASADTSETGIVYLVKL